jgi:Uma2 family endonuclease
MEAIAIPRGFRVTPEQFEQLASNEQLARLELTKDGELIVMSPTGGTAGEKNFNLYIDLGIWNRQTKLGKAFDSSTIFVLPNGARRSPDVSWVRLEKWNRLTQAQQDGFLPLAPDFVIELVSPSDLKNQRYEDLQAKMTSDPAPTTGARERARMQEYLDNGVELGWLIEPSAQTVEIYRSWQQVEILNNPQILSGENILPGYNLDLSEIFHS